MANSYIAVCAGNFVQFRDWCKDNFGWNEMYAQHHGVIFMEPITHRRRLLGINARVILVKTGTWAERFTSYEMEQIQDQVRICNATAAALAMTLR